VNDADDRGLFAYPKACKPQIDLFQDLFPKGSPKTKKAALAAAIRVADKVRHDSTPIAVVFRVTVRSEAVLSPVLYLEAL